MLKAFVFVFTLKTKFLQFDVMITRNGLMGENLHSSHLFVLKICLGVSVFGQ